MHADMFHVVPRETDRHIETETERQKQRDKQTDRQRQTDAEREARLQKCTKMENMTLSGLQCFVTSFHFKVETSWTLSKNLLPVGVRALETANGTGRFCCNG